MKKMVYFSQKLQNTACNSTSSESKFGTCYTIEECKNKDGVASGSCANGYGVCCLSKYTYLL